MLYNSVFLSGHKFTFVVLGPEQERERRCAVAEKVQEVENVVLSPLRLRKELSMGVSVSFLNKNDISRQKCKTTFQKQDLISMWPARSLEPQLPDNILAPQEAASQSSLGKFRLWSGDRNIPVWDTVLQILLAGNWTKLDVSQKWMAAIPTSIFYKEKISPPAV